MYIYIYTYIFKIYIYCLASIYRGLSYAHFNTKYNVLIILHYVDHLGRCTYGVAIITFRTMDDKRVHVHLVTWSTSRGL